MNKILLLPPVAFLIFLAASWLFGRLLTVFSLKGKTTARGLEPYSCGERNYDPLISPDYSQFFPFALFFTLLEVAALVLATVPRIGVETLAMAGIYIMVVIAGLSIIYRR